MKIIYKYPLEFKEGIQEVKIDGSVDILDIEFQGDKLFLWALIDKSWEPVVKKIVMFATGEKINIPVFNLSYIKTIHKDGFVWHFFEVNGD